MTWDERVPQREENGQWKPPRPKHSNILTGDGSDGVWYQYHNGQTTMVPEPPAALTKHFKTFSFYYDKGFWVYPCNASRYKVGDGKIDPPSNEDDADENGDSSGDEDDDMEDDNLLDDWKQLTFIWDINNTATSFATIRAEEPVLQTQRRDQQPWIEEILPDRYHAAGASSTDASRPGGLVGKIPILIALIAYSVQPPRVPNTLMQCLGRTYYPHGHPRGDGCKLHSDMLSDRY